MICSVPIILKVSLKKIGLAGHRPWLIYLNCIIPQRQHQRPSPSPPIAQIRPSLDSTNGCMKKRETPPFGPAQPVARQRIMMAFFPFFCGKAFGRPERTGVWVGTPRPENQAIPPCPVLLPQTTIRMIEPERGAWSGRRQRSSQNGPIPDTSDFHNEANRPVRFASILCARPGRTDSPSRGGFSGPVDSLTRIIHRTNYLYGFQTGTNPCARVGFV